MPIDSRKIPRLPAFGLVFVFFMISLRWLASNGPLGAGSGIFIAGYAASFGFFLALLKLWPSGIKPWYLFLLALAARVALFDFPMSDDVFRYAWEGAIQHDGFNPYLLAPDSPQLEHLRTSWWENINHRHIPAIYFPFAQLLFRTITLVSSSPLAFKTVFTMFDLATVAVVMAICIRLSLPLSRAAIYALNPLVLLTIAGESHLESVLAFFVSLMILFTLKHRLLAAYASVGAAFMTKLTAGVFLPFLFHPKRGWKIIGFAVPVLLFLLYWGPDVNFLSVPLMFGSQFRFNGPLFFVANLFLNPGLATSLCWIALAVFLCAVFFLQPNPLRASFLAATGLLMCSPTLHPWYLILLTPFLVLFPSSPLLLLHLTIAFTFPVYARFWESGRWVEPSWMVPVEFIPVVVLALWNHRTSRAWGLRKFRDPKSISVVIPAYNEERSIEGCIRSVYSQRTQPEEVILVDGGSRDSTIPVAMKAGNVSVIRSELGRGIQIAEGVRQSTGDIILILHADSVLSEAALERMLHALRKNPFSPGGAFGAQFSDKRHRMHLVSFLNNFRAAVRGISFGDQGQFVRRDALDMSFPAFKLMEDVELSIRMKEKGAPLFLSGGLQSSNRRWKKVNYLANVFKVIILTMTYIVHRRLGIVRGRAEWYYQAYYGAPA